VYVERALTVQRGEVVAELVVELVNNIIFLLRVDGIIVNLYEYYSGVTCNQYATSVDP
jgi:hypothetical protein